MLNAYNEKILQRNKIELSDTIIIKISERGIERISVEGENLYKSISDLILYVSGAASCSTADLIVVLTSINESLDNIRKHLNSAYFDTWRYIQVRIGYWKENIYVPQSRSLIVRDAFKRWRDSGLNPYKK
jgi:hypothetical protein